MNRIYDLDQPLSEEAKTIIDAIAAKMGKVPNAYKAITALAPPAMQVALQIDAALKSSRLSPKEIEAVRLAISQVAHCDYCLAAHTAVSKSLRLDADTIKALRNGQPSGDARLDALVRFARYVVRHPGDVAEAELEAITAAGFDASQITYVLLAITGITFTNLFNRVNMTALDFPAAD